MLEKKNIFFTNYKLTYNCRNSISIIKEVDDMFGLKTRFIKVDEKGAPVAKKIYKKDKDQIENQKNRKSWRRN
jgi:predicted component of viral defense system (DUF524 family)